VVVRRGGRERLGRRSERHAARAGAAGRHEREAGVLALLAHAGHVLEAGGRHQQGRLRVAHAERSQALELLGEVESQHAAGHHGVHALDRDQVLRRERLPGVRGEGGTERLDGTGVELHPGRHAVPAEAGQVAGAGR
jgi:hypothetical protein